MTDHWQNDTLAAMLARVIKSTNLAEWLPANQSAASIPTEELRRKLIQEVFSSTRTAPSSAVSTPITTPHNVPSEVHYCNNIVRGKKCVRPACGNNPWCAPCITNEKRKTKRVTVPTAAVVEEQVDVEPIQRDHLDNYLTPYDENQPNVFQDVMFHFLVEDTFDGNYILLGKYSPGAAEITLIEQLSEEEKQVAVKRGYLLEPVPVASSSTDPPLGKKGAIHVDNVKTFSFKK